MKPISLFLLYISLAGFCLKGICQDITITNESLLKAADNTWIEISPAAAIPLYDTLLKKLNPAEEPFRSQIIMRAAQARLASGDKDGCLEALKLLDNLEYIPEHHALRAGELKETIKTGRYTGYQFTLLPKLGKVDVTIELTPEGKPLASAISEARTVMSDGRSAEITLAPGTYFLKESILLSEQDAGLIIRSRDPEQPALLTGGITLNRWMPVTDPDVLDQLPESVRDKVLVCDLSVHGIDQLGELTFGGFSSERAQGTHARFGTLPVPEFFYKGEPQTMARWPNDELTVLPIEQDPDTADPRFIRWAKETDLWLYGYWYWDWADAYEKVAQISPSGRITLEPPTNRYGFRRNTGCAINALSELDQPGEWHLDTKRNMIHYLPPDDFDPNLTILSVFTGPVITADNCPNLQIRDLAIHYIRGDALEFINCSNLTLARIDIRNCSGLGIRVYGGKQHLIHSCNISSMGRGGIDFSGGDWQKLVPCNSIIENCRISDLSRVDRTYTPALLLEGMGIKVRNNSFINIPSSAIRVEACDALIELNYFYNCVYESGDQGAIDMWANPLYRGNVIRWNDFDRIINIKGGSYGTAAIRHDDWISGFMVSENIFRKGTPGQFGAVQFNQGTDNYVEGNIIIDWPLAFSGHSIAGEAWKNAITSHPHSKQILENTPWQSKAWQKKYPKVRNLLDGENNHNYLTDNQRHGTGEWGTVRGSVLFANTDGDQNFDGETLESVKSLIVPWRNIPIDRIGPYEPDDMKYITGQNIQMKKEESCTALPAEDSLVTILTPPYLQNMSQTGMVIMAEAADNIPLAVEYGKTTGYGFTIPMKLNASGGDTYFCRAVISGLEPGTTYNYRLVLSSGEGITENATFTTSPAGWIDFNFAALGDTQQGNTVGSHGDRKYWEADPWEPGNSMFLHMVEQDISLFVGIGDHAADGDDYSKTRLSYLERMAAILGQHVPYFISWGNHDGNSPDHPLRLAADMPGRWRTDNSSVHSPGYGSFAFEYSGVFFICLEHFTTTALEADDPGNDITNGWLDSVLSTQAAHDARYRILSVHVPPFCERWTHGNAKLREHLVPRLEKYNVDICFSGHMHGYERGYLNGVHYVIAGGGSYLDCFEPIVYEWPHMFIGGQINGEPSNVPGEYRRQSSYGILGPPEPIDGGIFHGYAEVTVRNRYLRMDMHGFNADGSYIGILDSFEINGHAP